MSRDDGFQIADIDSSYLDDAKMRALWQRLRDVDLMARAVVLHKATLLASWRHGERVTVMEAAPIWLPVDADLVTHLQAVRLLDRTGRVAPATWTHWFGAALDRRDKRRAAGAAGGRASGKRRSTNREATVQQPSSDAEPDQPASHTDHPADRPPGAPDPADTYWNLTGKYPTDKVLVWIDDLIGQFGADAVSRGLATRHQESADVRTLLGRVGDALKREARQLDRAERETEQRKVAENRRLNVPLLVARHNNGQHVEAPDPVCPSCQEKAA